MTDALLRFLLSGYLAIWSPALCCCDVQSALGNMTGQASLRCGERAAAEHSRALQRREAGAFPGSAVAARGCCASQYRALTPSSDSPRCSALCANETGPNEPQTPCRCHESIESKVRLDTRAKTTLVASTSIDIAYAASPACSIAIHCTCAAAITRPNQPQCAGPPPFATLHAQQTLLLH